MAETMSELEQLAGEDEVLRSMVTHLKELSEDEKIRQQCAARDDYERRLIGEYNCGQREGIETGRLEGIETGRLEGIETGRLEGRLEGELNALRNLIDTLKLTAEQAMDVLKIPESERALLLKQL